MNVLRRVGRRGLAETVTETCSALRDAVREDWCRCRRPGAHGCGGGGVSTVLCLRLRAVA